MNKINDFPIYDYYIRKDTHITKNKIRIGVINNRTAIILSLKSKKMKDRINGIEKREMKDK